MNKKIHRSFFILFIFIFIIFLKLLCVRLPGGTKCIMHNKYIIFTETEKRYIITTCTFGIL